MKTKGLLDKLISEKVMEIYIIAAIVGIPSFALMTETFGRPFITQPYVVSALGYVGAILCICSMFKRRTELFLTDILYILLVCFMSLSFVFSKDIYESILGFWYDEFFSHFLAYFSLMFAATTINDEKRRKRILVAFLAVIVGHSLIAVFQTMNICISPCCLSLDIHKVGEDICWGLTQHPNWYGGLSTLFCACSAGMYLFTENNRRRNIYFCINMVAFYTMLSAEARLAWVGTIAYICFYAISIAIMKEKRLWKRFGVMIIGMIIVILFAIFVCGRILERFERTSEELKSSNVEGVGSGRLHIWRFALESVPDNWVFGLGLDNLKDAYVLNPRFTDGMLFNEKAHNEYIHYLATQGVFQLLTYMTLLVYAVVRGVKTVLHTEDKSNRYMTWIFLGMFAAYSTQAMFNSSVINIAPYFWITIGMCVPYKNQKLKIKTNSN